MHIEQIYTGCLAHGAYYIESNGEAAIVDPLREVQPYMDRATKSGSKIKYVLETHFHADFVSGHLDLAKKTGATIVYGPTAEPGFEAHVAEDNELLKVGNVTIQVLHTPGHTMESSCFLLKDETGKDVAVFTGDTLFIGDVGRPDLAQKAGVITLEDLAGHLYHSLRTKIMTLPDDVIVYPGHGAGSACGKKMSNETTSTISAQKATNYALRANMTQSEFIKEVTEGLTPPPKYFPMNVRMNKQGYESFDTVMERAAQSLSPAGFEEAVNATEALVLDVRPAQEFAKGFIPNAINISLDGQFAPWVGALIMDVQQPIALVTPVGREEETITRLSRIGFDHVVGYLKGGMESWIDAVREVDQIHSITPEEFAERAKNKAGLKLVDVRRAAEFDAEHVKGVKNYPLDYINDYLGELDRNETYYLYCATGNRSMIAASILRSRGFGHVVDIKGGIKAIQESRLFELTDSASSGTLKENKEEAVA